MLQNRTRLLQSLAHSVAWLCLFLYPFLFHYVPFDNAFAVMRIVFFLLLIISFFYFNSLVLIPKVLGRKKVVVYFLCVAALVTLIGFVSGYMEYFFNKDFSKEHDSYVTMRNTGVIVAILAWIVSSGMKITLEWFRTERLKKNIENEKLQAELLFLKSQMKPHFIFNALNNIYSLEQHHSPNTGEAILKLSDLLRYILYETSEKYVTLEQEVNYLENYIALQKMGMSSDIPVEFSVEGDCSGKKIEPMLLLPLVENTFKHGVSYVHKKGISIRIAVNGNRFSLHAENTAFPPVKNGEKSSGIGLANLRRRLGLLYPSHHSLTVTEKDNRFIAELTIDLNHDEVHDR